MQIQKVNFNINNTQWNWQLHKQSGQNEMPNNTCAHEYSKYNLKNYIIPFMGNDDFNMPDDLEMNLISECYPVKEKGKSTEKLSGILSTALYYINPERPVVLGSSNREVSGDFLKRMVSDTNVTSVIFVEDDRIEGEPILFYVNNTEPDVLKIIGCCSILDMDTNERTYVNEYEGAPINPKSQCIQLAYTDMQMLSVGEEPFRADLNNVVVFPIEEVLSDDFKKTGCAKLYNFTKSTIKAAHKASKYPMFSDIGGNKEAIQKVVENIYAPMARPDLFGHQMTKGSILEGPAGTGKSMIGLALANELSSRLGTDVHLQMISGAEMQESLVGGSEANWRNLFETAIKNQPALIIIDEIDACIPKRDSSSNARYDNQVVNQILTLMSNLEKSDNNVYVIGMTNMLDMIDPAMLRGGRFGNIISVPAPSFDEAKDIYNKISGKYNISEDFDADSFLKKIVNIKGTGATITHTLENAKKYAMRNAGIYMKVFNGTCTKEDVDAVTIMSEDIYKAFADEEDKLKKAKINSGRTVIKGFVR